MWLGLTPVPVVPSPKSHEYDVIVDPGAVEAEASKKHVALGQEG